jgi:hypothetical protein
LGGGGEVSWEIDRLAKIKLVGFVFFLESTVKKLSKSKFLAILVKQLILYWIS